MFLGVQTLVWASYPKVWTPERNCTTTSKLTEILIMLNLYFSVKKIVCYPLSGLMILFIVNILVIESSVLAKTCPGAIDPGTVNLNTGKVSFPPVTLALLPERGCLEYADDLPIENRVKTYDVNGSLLVNDFLINAEVGFSVSFTLQNDIEQGERLAIWLGSNTNSFLYRSGIEILFDTNTVQINIKYPDTNWNVLPPAATNPALKNGDQIKIKVLKNNIIEIFTNNRLRSKFFLAESLTQNYGSILGNGLGVNVLWQATQLINKITVKKLIDQAQTGFKINQCYQVGETPYFITEAKLNKDNFIDLVVVNRGPFTGKLASKYVSILYGRSGGSFSPSINHVVGQGPYMAQIADINNDGLEDILVSSFYTWTNRSLTIMLGRNEENPSSGPLGNYGLQGAFDTSFVSLPYTHPVSRKKMGHEWPIPGATSLVIKDFNQDGNLDIATTGWTNDTIYILLGNGKGHFSFFQEYNSKKYGIAFRDINSTDLDGDGFLDLAVTAYLSDEVSIFKGHGDGKFTFCKTYPSGGDTPYFLNFADFNKDKKQDIVVGNYSGEVKLLINSGDFGFESGGIYKNFAAQWKKYEVSPTSDGYGNMEYPDWNDYWNIVRDVVPHDFNNDGFVDLATVSEGPNSGFFSILFGSDVTQTERYFQETVQYYIGKGPRSLLIRDFDQNNTTDIAIVRASGNDICILTK
jgi:hypothetical protein